MDTYEDLEPILQILLGAIAQECGTTQDYLSNEVEQVARQSLIAAQQTRDIHERPTAVRPVDPNLRRPRGTFGDDD